MSLSHFACVHSYRHYIEPIKKHENCMSHNVRLVENYSVRSATAEYQNPTLSQSGPPVINFFSFPTQLSMKFIMLKC